MALGTQHFWLAKGSRDAAVRGVQEVYAAIGLRLATGGEGEDWEAWRRALVKALAALPGDALCRVHHQGGFVRPHLAQRFGREIRRVGLDQQALAAPMAAAHQLFPGWQRTGFDGERLDERAVGVLQLIAGIQQADGGLALFERGDVAGASPAASA